MHASEMAHNPGKLINGAVQSKKHRQGIYALQTLKAVNLCTRVQ